MLFVFLVVLLALVGGGVLLVLAVTRGSRGVAIGTGLALGALVMTVLMGAWLRATARRPPGEGPVAGEAGMPDAPDRAAQWREVRRVAGQWEPPAGTAAVDDFFPPDVAEFRLRRAEPGPAAPRLSAGAAAPGSPDGMIDGFVGLYRSDTDSVEVRAFRVGEAGHAAYQAALDRRESAGDLPFDDLVWAAGWGFGFRHSDPDRLPAFIERYFHRLPGFPGLQPRVEGAASPAPPVEAE